MPKTKDGPNYDYDYDYDYYAAEPHQRNKGNTGGGGCLGGRLGGNGRGDHSLFVRSQEE